ncbi:hypothetical protein [Natronosalvus amylolyticus]|uniref:hypothetical protein n=1 Tax=Natronosalvus amylolyticus TaxID=2961994 RepID=UPI0020C9CB70|nr:hypothetical protein [Natronosalvus amylolyticus]
MTDTLTSRPGTTRIGSIESAAVAAYDALEAEGCTDIETSLPHQTRGTWIVPATTDDGRYHVHIDPKTGSTRVSKRRE